ncbi:GMC family oxidoreductase [Candidatus Magnetomonas plexicatena]|nr:GMC family oxidoreductase [Nitrospirales bacterium LBB_01]
MLLLEAGDAYNPTKDYQLDKPQWEQTGFPMKEPHDRFYTFKKMQKLNEQYSSLTSFNHITGKSNKTNRRQPGAYHHLRAVGGSTLMFSGEAHRLNPNAMKMKTRFGVAADWPMDYKELEPFYETAEKVIGVSGQSEGNPLSPKTAPYPLPPHKISYSSSIISAAKHGINFVPNSLAILSKPYDGRAACNYCGGCLRGCMLKDKGSTDVTFIAKALSTGYLTIKTQSAAVNIEAGPNDKVVQIQYVDDKMRYQSAKGKIFIVSCGAVHTPRLLLLSNNRYSPDGLCNEYGLVGRNFMETLLCSISGLYDKRIESYRGLPADIISWDYNNPDAIKDVIGGCRFTAGAIEADFTGPINYALRVAGGFGKQHKDEMRKSFGNVLTIKAIGENLPNKKSYVGLDKKKRDAYGMPLPKICSYLDEMELKRLKFMVEKSTEVLKATGVSKIIEQSSTYDIFNSTHVFGTCRMGTDMKESAVNQFCQSFKWKNLFVVDSSVFPSSGGGESPSLTINALALRTAKYITGNDK